jgi:hypothetical protein
MSAGDDQGRGARPAIGLEGSLRRAVERTALDHVTQPDLCEAKWFFDYPPTSAMIRPVESPKS